MQEILLTGRMYAFEEAAAKPMFHMVESSWEATLAAAQHKVAYNEASVKAYGQMKAKSRVLAQYTDSVKPLIIGLC